MKFFIDPADLNPDFDTSTGTRSAEDLTLPGSRSYYSIKQKPTPSPPDGLAGAQSPTPSVGGSGGYQYNLELLHTQPIKRANQAAGSVPPPRPELTQQYYEYMAAQSKGVNLRSLLDNKRTIDNFVFPYKSKGIITWDTFSQAPKNSGTEFDLNTLRFNQLSNSSQSRISKCIRTMH